MLYSQTSANDRGWVRWLLLFAVGVLLAFLIALAGFWQYYKTTPSYTVALLIDAAERNDGEELDRLIDVDRVLADVTRQETQRMTRGLIPGDFVGALQGPANSVAPETVKHLKMLAREEIRLRILDETGDSAWRPFFITALGVPFRLEVTRSDQTARVMTTDSERLELLLVYQDDRWRLHAVHDDKLTSRLLTKVLQGAASAVEGKR